MIQLSRPFRRAVATTVTVAPMPGSRLVQPYDVSGPRCLTCFPAPISFRCREQHHEIDEGEL